MNTDNQRVTMIMGAGAVLDMNFPCNIIKPTTMNITMEVIKPYDDIFHMDRKISIVKDIYDKLVREVPTDPNIWWVSNPTPNIHFEILFHVMEQLMAYRSVWARNNHNPYAFPHFAPFTAQNFNFDFNDLHQVMWKFIMRIMEIVYAYDNYFSNDGGAEDWYRDFFKSKFKWDIFNLNYDTTVEQSLGVYEDGFEQASDRIDNIFRPQKLMSNINNLSTINHVHGCINYYYKNNANDDLFETSSHDLYLYPNFDEVRRRMIGRGQSNPSAQNNEEYFAGPIITGLRKTDKLICMPYDFYHGNLYRAIIDNNALVIAGYSFGDLYINNIVNRMHAIWGGKERIVVIDKWDSSKIRKYKLQLEKYLQTLPNEELYFLMYMSGCANISEMVKNFIDIDVSRPKYSKNGCLMLITNGMKSASRIRDEIYSYLES